MIETGSLGPQEAHHTPLAMRGPGVRYLTENIWNAFTLATLKYTEVVMKARKESK